MTWVALLFLIGLVLISFELIIPGGILGILGGTALITALVFAFLEYGAAGGLAATLGGLLILTVSVYLELKLLPRTSLGRSFFLRASNRATSQGKEPGPSARSEFLGKPAETVTPLSPTGIILLDGKQYEAFSQTGLIERGTAVRVVGVDNFRLIVKKAKS